ncbi:MAG TPA: MFS transporter [Chloroflexota bacterium]|nr:MFS transporter [Chloroflexota bacterium]
MSEAAEWPADRLQDAEEWLEEQVGGPVRRKAVLLLASVLGLEAADLATTGAVAAKLEPAFHIGTFEIGLLVSVTLFMAAIATLPCGILVDRISRTKLLAGSILLWCAAIVAGGASVDYLMLVLSRLALGAVTATGLPAIASLTGDFFPGKDRARIYGYILGGELVGAGVGYFISGNIAGFASWRWSFWWLIVPGLALSWALWTKLEEPERGHHERTRPPRRQDAGAAVNDRLVLRQNPRDMSVWHAVRYVLSIRTNVILIVASALGYFFFEATRTLGLLFVRGHYNLGQNTATSLLVVLGIGALAGVVGSGRLSDWLGRKGKRNARISVPSVAFLLSAVAFAPGLWSTSLSVAIPLFIAGAAALSATNPPMDAARLDIMPAGLWGRAESVRTVLRSSLQGAAPLVVGFLADYLGHGQPGSGLEYALLLALIPVAVAGFILLFALTSYRSDAATADASSRAGA